MLERIQKKLTSVKRPAFIRSALLVIGVIGIFGVLSIWAPVSVLLIALVVIAFVGGASLGKGAAILVPVAVVVIVARAEFVTARPVEVQTFLLGGIVFLLLLSMVALVGARVRRVGRRPSAGRRPSG